MVDQVIQKTDTHDYEVDIINQLRNRAHELAMEIKSPPSVVGRGVAAYPEFKQILLELWRIIKMQLPDNEQKRVDEVLNAKAEYKHSDELIAKANLMFDEVYKAIYAAGYGSHPHPLSRAKLTNKYPDIDIEGV